MSRLGFEMAYSTRLLTSGDTAQKPSPLKKRQEYLFWEVKKAVPILGNESMPCKDKERDRLSPL